MAEVEQIFTPDSSDKQTKVGLYRHVLLVDENGVPSGFKKAAFGENSVARNKAYIQATSIYGLVPANFRTFTTLSGTAGVENRLFKVSTGTTQFGYGAIQSFRSINYQAGQGVLARFSGIFESNVANSWQGIGLISIGDELSFGYNGTTFGIWHRRNGLAEVRTITISTGAGGAETLTLTLNSVAYSIPITSGTTSHNAYEIAAWLNANQSVWTADQIGATVIISALSDGAKSGTYTYSSSGTGAGSIAQNTAGVTKTSDFIAQADWNGVSLSTFDPSKGNLYKIKYQYLGFGDVEFSILNPTTGIFSLVHTIKYSNLNTELSLGNPSLRVGMYVASIGSTTDLVVKSASFAGFIQGEEESTRNPRATKFTQTVTSSFTNIITLRNRKTYNGYVNQSEIEPRRLSVSSESTKNVEIELRSMVTPGVEQNFQAVGTNLISDIATNAVTGITTGNLLFSTTLSSGGSVAINLKELDIRMPPSLHLVLQGRVTSGASAALTGTITWYEDI